MFSKNLYFLENHDFIENNCKKVDFFSCDFYIFDGTIGCATKFHTNKFYFFSIFVRSKVIAFFVKNLPKLNILSVIAIDLVKIFKQIKNHLAHFIKV